MKSSYMIKLHISQERLVLHFFIQKIFLKVVILPNHVLSFSSINRKSYQYFYTTLFFGLQIKLVLYYLIFIHTILQSLNTFISTVYITFQVVYHSLALFICCNQTYVCLVYYLIPSWLRFRKNSSRIVQDSVQFIVTNNSRKPVFYNTQSLL